MKQKLLLLTPPFVQLNTPYPATAYLKGFLNTLGYESVQADLGIEVILAIFSKTGLTAIFQEAALRFDTLSENSQRIVTFQEEYIATIEPTIRFLQHKNPTLALAISDRSYLPEAARFAQLDDLEWAFGAMGTHDKARHYATLYLEDLGDLIQETIDEHFGFSRYAERLGRTATHFEPIDKALCQPNSLISEILIDCLKQKIAFAKPTVVAITIPFPGNLFAALKCGQYIKQHYPDIKVIIGGGYCNTELRSLSDEKVFDYIDFVSLDDGELPIKLLLEHFENQRDILQLKRVFTKIGGVVSYINNAIEKDIPQRETGTPDYSDLRLDEYLSVIEIANPMHRLWSDGRWNKLTLAHGCYWGKCSFCDISLDYIGRYEPITAAMLCDRITTIIAQTGETGFHFVDEAAPPALMRDLAIEILRRKITITWWTNIRFEKSFTPDLCRLLKASGCIAVSGGLEVASDRLLALMEKGVTVAQVARVAEAFTAAGIMVHAYLMYGFPTQTAQETIDSLENVRQLFDTGIVQSGFWHQFAMTSHSPVGLNPAKYGVQKIGPTFGGFADNDLYHSDTKGAQHELFSAGLKKSLFNYMHGVGLDFPLQDWFDFKVPRTKVTPDFIANALSTPAARNPKANNYILWLATDIQLVTLPKQQASAKKTKPSEWVTLRIADKKDTFELQTSATTASFLLSVLPPLKPTLQHPPMQWQAFTTLFDQAQLDDYEDINDFAQSFTFQQLCDIGLIIV